MAGNSITDFMKYFLFACILFQMVCATTPKAVVYWGQNSAGSFTTDPALQEAPLATFCEDDTYDIIVMGFVNVFPMAQGSEYPGMNLANHCFNTFDNEPYLLDCPQVSENITYCQSRGKIILMSFGGAIGTYGFTDDAQAQAFATTVWELFLGGSSTMRPFGDTIIDGVDLDIEGGYITGYAAFVTALRGYFAGASKTYYISAAPQCPFPDGYLGPTAGAAFQLSWFDFVWVQFYNNYCGLNAYPSEFNFGSWASWAANTSINPNVKIFIGAAAYAPYVGSGYVDLATLQTIITAVSGQYPNAFGGIMFWDASATALNDGFNTEVISFLKGENLTPTPTPSVTTGSALPSTTAAPPKPSTTAAPPKSSTTAAPLKPSTTGSKGTTGSKASASTTAAPVNPQSTTGAKVSQSSTTGYVPPVWTSPCVTGQMACYTSESYRTCSHGAWDVVQNCQTGLQCVPVGTYIYCE